MLVIQRDKNTPGDRFTVRAKEQGWRGGPKVSNLSIKEAMLAVEHYFVGGHAGAKRGCPFCKRQHEGRLE